MSATSEAVHAQIVLLDEAIKMAQAEGRDTKILEEERAHCARKLQVTQKALTEGKKNLLTG